MPGGAGKHTWAFRREKRVAASLARRMRRKAARRAATRRYNRGRAVCVAAELVGEPREDAPATTARGGQDDRRAQDRREDEEYEAAARRVFEEGPWGPADEEDPEIRALDRPTWLAHFGFEILDEKRGVLERGVIQAAARYARYLSLNIRGGCEEDVVLAGHAVQYRSAVMAEFEMDNPLL